MSVTENWLVCGVDEAGRGPLAGEVVAAAVVFGAAPPAGLRDSKRLSAARRRALADEIREGCLAFAVGTASVAEIAQYNIRQATMFAMQRAVHGIIVCPDEVLVDGDFVPDLPYRARAIVGGDAVEESIMAASILAKTTRDAMMAKMHAEYPQYGFDRHKGYGTPEHLANLRRFGPCPHHRAEFAPVREAMRAGAAGVEAG